MILADRKTFTFARDLRTCQMLREALQENEGEMRKVNPRIRGLLKKMVEIAGDTVKGVRGRQRDLKAFLDGQEA